MLITKYFSRNLNLKLIISVVEIWVIQQVVPSTQYGKYSNHTMQFHYVVCSTQYVVCSTQYVVSSGQYIVCSRQYVVPSRQYVVGSIQHLRSEEKKSAHVFVRITRIMLGLDKNQSNQQKVHILRIQNWQGKFMQSKKYPQEV